MTHLQLDEKHRVRKERSLVIILYNHSDKAHTAVNVAHTLSPVNKVSTLVTELTTKAL